MDIRAATTLLPETFVNPEVKELLTFHIYQIYLRYKLLCVIRNEYDIRVMERIDN